MDNSEIIEFYIDNDILVSPDILDTIKDIPLILNTKFIVLGKDTREIISAKKNIVVEDFEKALVLKEKHKDTRLYSRFIEYLSLSPEHSSIIKKTDIVKDKHSTIDTNNLDENILTVNDVVIDTNTVSKKQALYHDVVSSRISADMKISGELTNSSKSINLSREEYFNKNKIKIISSYNTKVRKWSVHDFVSLYTVRFKELEKILHSRQELQSLTSISRINGKKERENVAIIGVVYDKSLTKTGNIMLTLEDPTGMIKAVVNKNKEELFRLAEEIQLDETIGITGMCDQIVFVNSILLPDIPLTKELKKSPDEGYFVVIADPEPGSKLFLDKEFDKLILWLNGEVGSEKQREVASKVKYIFIAGDLVNGVGIYPGQEFDLNILDIREQYTALANLLKQIPSNIPIFICPGNHDVGRISEPQPAIDEEYAADLVSMPNIVSLSNPSTVNIYAQPENNFDGFDVMFYHGYSFIYYSENVPLIRKAGGQKRPDMIMKYLLQRRHLAPSHTSTLYIPDPKSDPLVIDKVPDFLLTGHVHRAMVSNYKNVTCINASCWNDQSEEQERRGLEAQPARAFIVDMHTREVKIMNFMPKEEQEKEQSTSSSTAQTASLSAMQTTSQAVDGKSEVSPKLEVRNG